MPFLTSGELRYYQFDGFGEGVIHAVFTRQGGVSPDPWRGLNVGGTVGDDPERVSENRWRALAALGREPASVFDVWQVHGVDVAFAEAPRQPEMAHLQADIILTDKPGVTLMMRFADCVPILLYDPICKVAGIVHAGWMGTVHGTASVAVKAMQTRYGSNPTDIHAGIGPSIGPDHYEIGPDVIVQVRRAFGSETDDLLVAQASSTIFNLWAANRKNLEKAGVRKIETAGICTACHTEDWFSHRAERGRTGRFGAIIALKN